MSTVQIHAAGEREQQAVVDVITLAFGTDPMARWACPHPQTYLAIMPETVKLFGGNGFAHPTVHLVDGGGAAAMWLPPVVHTDSERLEALTARQAPPDRQADMAQVFEQMGRFHPVEPLLVSAGHRRGPHVPGTRLADPRRSHSRR